MEMHTSNHFRITYFVSGQSDEFISFTSVSLVFDDHNTILYYRYKVKNKRYFQQKKKVKNIVF